MAANFPKLPGYVPTHDCTNVAHAMTSHVKLEKKMNAKNKDVPLYALPRAPQAGHVPEKTQDSKSFSQTKFVNHFQSNENEFFEPTFVKLDKQVLRFFGHFKESVCESNLENYKLRHLIITYYLEDNSVMMTEPLQVNSGTPQGVFLKRQMVLGANEEPISAEQFRVGGEIVILGRTIHIRECDQYTRDFYSNVGQDQEAGEDRPADGFEKSQIKPIPMKDAAMKDFLEHTLGGGRVKSQKQFLDHDRKVLRFFTESDGLPYTLHYYLADDTIDVREVHFANNGRDQFPLLLKRQKLPKLLEVNQPGQNPEVESYLTHAEILPGQDINAFGRVFRITGVDTFTNEFMRSNHGYNFDVGAIEERKIPEQAPI